MRRPRVTFSRNGRISSGHVGPPNAISRTASLEAISRAARALRQLVYRVDARPHVVDGGGRQHAVSEIEDVPWPAGRLTQDGRDALADLRDGREQRHRIEVPLHRHVRPEPAPGGVEI